MYPQRSVMTCGLATALEPPYFNHAPAWGATTPAMWQKNKEKSFNPRTRVGCDVDAKSTAAERAQFQSTHPRGVRHGRSSTVL